MFLRNEKLGFILSTCLTAASLSALPTVARAQVRPVPGPIGARAVFDLDRKVLAGNGCPIGSDADVVASGNALRLFLPDFHLVLSERTARVACRLVVPVSIPEGYYLSEAFLDGEYYVTKSSQASAAIASNIALAGDAGNLEEINFPMGTSRSGYFDLENRAALSGTEQCRGGASNDRILTLQLAASALGNEFGARAYVGLTRGGRASLSVRLSRCP